MLLTLKMIYLSFNFSIVFFILFSIFLFLYLLINTNKKNYFSTLSPKVAKKKVKSMIACSDWQQVKVDIMKEIVTNKCVQNPDLKEKLLATGDRKLVE